MRAPRVALGVGGGGLRAGGVDEGGVDCVVEAGRVLQNRVRAGRAKTVQSETRKQRAGAPQFDGGTGCILDAPEEASLMSRAGCVLLWLVPLVGLFVW